MKSLISTRLATIIFAVIIGFFGVNDIMYAKVMASDMPSFLPFPTVLIFISGIGFLLAAIAFILNRYAKLAGYLLALLLLVKVFSVDLIQVGHAAANVQMKVFFIKNVLKDAALAMAAVLIADISRERAG